MIVKQVIIFSVVLTASSAMAQLNDFSADIIRNQQRNEQLRNQINPQVDTLSDSPKKVVTEKQPVLSDLEESVCFPIDTIHLDGEWQQKFQPYFKQALNELQFSSGDCIGLNGINLIMSKAQNNMISAGYVTTRVLVEPQDLTQRELKLTLMAGKLRAIRVNSDNLAETRAHRVVLTTNVFPMESGDLLNLREIEQGLENLERVPTATATMEIEPGDAPNESDLVVTWQQRTVPYRLTLSVDDSGSKETGKNQGSITFSGDSIFGYSELIYLSLNRDLGHKSRGTDTSGKKVIGGTNGYAFHFSVPYKDWMFTVNASKYHYNQAVAGSFQIYNYNGDSKTADMSISRLLYRDSHRKTTASLKGWQRASRSYIDDAELTVQRRKVAGWQLSLDHREHINRAVLDLGLSYKRGTGAVHALRAPEQDFGEGTSRVKIFLLDLNLGVPFSIGQQNFYYNSTFHGQWSKTPLTSQDRISIGGRYTVRGFDGDMTLMAEKGFYLRNDLAWYYQPAHQFYVALDGGYVSGPSSKWLLGKELVGAAAGFKGQFDVGGKLSYDLFAGKALKKPKHFKTKKVAYGFSISYSL